MYLQVWVCSVNFLSLGLKIFQDNQDLKLRYVALWRFLEGKMLRKKDFEKERLQEGVRARFLILKYLEKSSRNLGSKISFRNHQLNAKLLRTTPILNLAILLQGVPHLHENH